MEKIRAALFVMDKFSVSWKACNELTQIDNSLPRSYLVEGCQATVDDQWKITKTQGNNPGAKKQKIIWKIETIRNRSQLSELRFLVMMPSCLIQATCLFFVSPG